MDKEADGREFIAAWVVVATLVGVPTAGCLVFAIRVLMHREGPEMTGSQVVDAALIVGLLSFFIPAIVAFLRGRNTPSEIVGVIVFGVVFVGALAAMFIQDEILDPPAFDNLRDQIKYYLVNFLAVLAMASVWYRMFYKTIAADLTARLEQTGPQPGDPKKG